MDVDPLDAATLEDVPKRTSWWLVSGTWAIAQWRSEYKIVTLIMPGTALSLIEIPALQP